VRTVPGFALYTLAFALQLKKITEKPQSGHPKGAPLTSAERDSFSRLGHRQALASTGLLAPAALGFWVWRRGQPAFSVGIRPVSALGSFPCQLSQSLQPGL